MFFSVFVPDILGLCKNKIIAYVIREKNLFGVRFDSETSAKRTHFSRHSDFYLHFCGTLTLSRVLEPVRTSRKCIIV